MQCEVRAAETRLSPRPHQRNSAPRDSTLACPSVRECPLTSLDGAGGVRCGGRIGIPFTWHPLEAAPAEVREDEPRADDEVSDRARHEHITGFCLRRDTCTDVDGEAANRRSVELVSA